MKPIEIKSESDYQRALLDIERLWNAVEGSDEEKRIRDVIAAVSAYDKGRSDTTHTDISCDGAPD